MTKTVATTVVAVVLAVPAMAIDLDAMSLSQRERYCIAYSFLDLEAQKQAGTIDQASYDHMRNRIIWEVFDKGGQPQLRPRAAGDRPGRQRHPRRAADLRRGGRAGTRLPRAASVVGASRAGRRSGPP